MNYLERNINKSFILDCLYTSNYDDFYKKLFNSKLSSSIYNYISQYPADPNYVDLKNKICKHFNIKEIILGAGGEDFVIKTNQFLFSKKIRVGIVRPIFYRIPETFKGKTKYLSEEDFLSERFYYLQAIWLTNPNLLTGTVFNAQKLIEIFSHNPKIIFIIDEAGIFLIKDWGKYSLLGREFNNVFIIESFSKAYGLSGMRASFATGNKFILNGIEESLLTFPITSMTERFINIILDNQSLIDKLKVKIQKNKDEIETILSQYQGFELIKNKTNCIFVRNKRKKIYPYLITAGVNCLDLDQESGTNKKGFVRLTIHSSKKSFTILKNCLLKILEKEYEKKN